MAPERGQAMPSSELRTWQAYYIVSSSFAFVSGYADVISLRRWKCFLSMLTGNCIWFGRTLGGNDPDRNELYGPHFYLAVVVAFSLGVVLYRCAELRWPERGGFRAAVPLALMSLICEVSVVSLDENWRGFQWLIVFYTPLFGVVCGACAGGKIGKSTTMVTGHVISAANHTVDACTRHLSIEEQRRLTMSLLVLLFTAMGAFLGEVCYRRTDTRWMDGLFLPVPLLLAALLWINDHLSRLHKLEKRVHRAARANARKRNTNAGDALSADSTLQDVTPSPTHSVDETKSEESEGEGEDGEVAASSIGSVADEAAGAGGPAVPPGKVAVASGGV